MCLHGFTDTWRTWELVLPALERRHDVLAPTLPGHAGGPPLADEPGVRGLLDAIERALDEAGFATAHVVGNSLGGYLALQLAARGRAESVVALAPAGGWAARRRLGPRHPRPLHQHARRAPEVSPLTPTRSSAAREGRRRATAFTTASFEHIPPELLAHQICGVAACTALESLLGYARRHGWDLDAERIACPVRIVWGTEDRLLPWPSSAARYRDEWLPHADWIVLDGVGHCPQLDVPLETAQLILGFTSP